MSIKISVIIPVYNMEAYLPTCLNSILGQTLKEIEILCIDDGSTDNTKAVLEEYSRKYNNIIVLHQDRRGPGPARNRGMEAAAGRFLSFMDADDYYPSPDVLETLFHQAVHNRVKAAGGNYLLDCEGTIMDHSRQKFCKDQVIRFQEYQYCYGYWRFIYSSDMIKENGICFPPYVVNQDPVFMLRSLASADQIWVTSKNTYVYRATDKKSKYNSSKVITDMIKGLYDVIHFCRIHNYNQLTETVVSEIQERKIVCFFMHILDGNEEIYSCWKQIGQELLLSECEKGIETYFDASRDEMEAYIKGYWERIRGYVHQMEKYEEVIIYGAGKTGRSVYDLIQARKHITFGGFAVSASNPQGSARGEAICCINKYLDRKEKALLVIAGRKNAAEQMERRAEELGFENRLIINEELVDLDSFCIADDRFPV